MSANNRIYQLALRSYPEPYRSECGAEVMHTALELRDGQWSLRETLGLLKGGIRARSIASTTGAGSSVWMSGLRLGLLFLLLSDLMMWFSSPTLIESELVGAPELLSASELAGVSQLPSTPELSGFAVALLVANILLMVAMAFSTGIAFASAMTAVTLVAVVVSIFQWRPDSVGFPYQFLVGTALVLGATWWVAWRGDGRRAISPLMLPVLAAAWFGIVSSGPSWTYLGIPFTTMGQLFVLVALGLVGVAAAALDPRLLAGTLIWLGFSALYTALSQGPGFIAMDYVRLLITSASFAAILGGGMWFGVRRFARV